MPMSNRVSDQQIIEAVAVYIRHDASRGKMSRVFASGTAAADTP